MSGLKPGEYVGVEKSYSIECFDGEDWYTVNRTHPDFPAAIEALQALVPEPFEWRPANGGCLRRYHNGRVEWRSGKGSWLRPSAEDGESSAFEAGRRYERERGHADE